MQLFMFKAVDTLPELNTLPESGKSRPWIVANRIMSADRLDELDDISSEEILELIPRLSEIISSLEENEKRLNEARQTLQRVPSVKGRRKLL